MDIYQKAVLPAGVLEAARVGSMREVASCLAHTLGIGSQSGDACNPDYLQFSSNYP